jgi:hypothetical protein
MSIKRKITNRSIWIFVILLWAAVLLYLMNRQRYYADEEIVEAFMQTPYQSVESTVEAFGTLPGSYLIEEEREKLVKEIASMLGITQPYSLDTTESEALQSVVLCKPSKQAVTNIVYQAKTETVDNLESQTGQYVSVSIVLSDSVESGVEYKDRLEQIFRIYGIEGNVSLSFTGQVAGNLSLKERNALAETLIDSLSGKVVSQYRSDALFTIYGYSKKLEEYEEVAGEKMNFNLAISYDEEQDVSCIYLATPYMTADY